MINIVAIVGIALGFAALIYKIYSDQKKDKDKTKPI